MSRPPAPSGSPPETPDADADIGDVLDAPDQALEPAELRDVDPPEREALVTLLHRYGDDVLTKLESDWTLKVLVRADVMPHRRVIAIDRARLADLAPYAPIHLGVPVAHLARNGARLTLEGGRLVTPHATRRVVRVGEKGETLFLYGRHLLVKSIRRVHGNPKPEDAVLVVSDRDGRYLGIGIATDALIAMRSAKSGGRGRPSPEEEEATAVRHQADLGLYLRNQQAVPE